MLIVNSYSKVISVGNLYIGANAANPNNEVNSNAGTNDASGNCTWYSRASGEGEGGPNPTDGSYFLEVVHGGPDNTLYIPSVILTGVEAGQNVQIKAWVRGDGVSAACRTILTEDPDWEVTASSSLTGAYEVWTEFTLYNTAKVNNPLLDFQFTSCADTNMAIQVDDIRVTIDTSLDNIFDGANAADPENEVNGTANTASSGSFPATISSVSTGTPTDGTYALEIVHNNGTDAIGLYYLNIMGTTFEASQTYQIKFDAKVTSGNEVWTIQYATADGWSANSSKAFNTGGDWIEVAFAANSAASAPGTWRFRIQTDATADAGDTVLIDNIRVYKLS